MPPAARGSSLLLKICVGALVTLVGANIAMLGAAGWRSGGSGGVGEGRIEPGDSQWDQRNLEQQQLLWQQQQQQYAMWEQARLAQQGQAPGTQVGTGVPGSSAFTPVLPGPPPAMPSVGPLAPAPPAVPSPAAPAPAPAPAPAQAGLGQGLALRGAGGVGPAPASPFGGAADAPSVGTGADAWGPAPATPAPAAPVPAAPLPVPVPAAPPAVGAPPASPASPQQPVGGGAVVPAPVPTAVAAVPAGGAINAHGIHVEDDVKWHRSHELCWDHFDLGFLRIWMDAMEVYCAPPGGAGEPVGSNSELRCRAIHDDHLPSATAPHTMCDAWNLQIDFGALSPAKCQQYRPGYNCDGEAVFWHYPKGALKGACEKQSVFALERFPRDHLRDVFGGFEPVASGQLLGAPTAAPVTLFITRERREYANLFHATTDFINAFEALHMAGIINAEDEGSRAGMESVQVVLLDEHPEGPFDGTLQKVFGPSYPLARGSHFRQSSPVTVFPRAVFAHPGYTNFMFVELQRRGSCRYSLQLLQSYTKFVLDALHLSVASKQPMDPVRVIFISRKPYKNFVDHKFMGRQVTNEDAVMEAMRTVPGVKPELRDFAQISFDEQIELMTSTDVLLGMHGAALTHALFMPAWAGVMELWPKTRDMWRCFEHLTEMSGRAYKRWELRDQRKFSRDRDGDYTTVDVHEFSDMFTDLVGQVRARRAAFLEGTLNME